MANLVEVMSLIQKINRFSEQSVIIEQMISYSYVTLGIIIALELGLAIMAITTATYYLLWILCFVHVHY